MEKIKILIVEDENILALGLKKKLEKLGYTVTDIAVLGPKPLIRSMRTSPN